MHDEHTVRAALAYATKGIHATEVARILGIPRETVRDWLAGATPARTHGSPCSHDFRALSGTYAYLLGLYLGDGCLSAHPRGVYRLRIALDLRYPGIITSAAEAMSEVRGRPSLIQRRVGHNYVEVNAYWKCWPCLFPQHGAGPKHKRLIALTDWQQQIVDRWPQDLLRGLIHSDGCRFQNTGRRNWSWPRYSFVNASDDIRRIFCETCDLLGVRYTFSGSRTIYVSRKADVAKLDTFIGPKQ